MSSPEVHRTKNSDLRLRVLSALVLGPVVLGLVYWGGLAYALLITAASVLFLWEWLEITGSRRFSLQHVLGLLVLAVAAILIVFSDPAIGLVAVLAGAFFCYAASQFSKVGRWAAEGVLYSGLSLYALIVVREGTHGLQVAFFLIFVVWATDIFAYFVGRSVGGPKLWPRVSPKKTWSGACGGFVLAILCGMLVAWMVGLTDIYAWGVLAGLLSIVSQAGDLLESAIKRRFDVKDSGQLIPGHGGIMDRIDGLVAAAIFAVVLGLVFGGTFADPIKGLGLG